MKFEIVRNITTLTNIKAKIEIVIEDKFSKVIPFLNVFLKLFWSIKNLSNIHC
jgi:hypothetical protein